MVAPAPVHKSHFTYQELRTIGRNSKRTNLYGWIFETTMEPTAGKPAPVTCERELPSIDREAQYTGGVGREVPGRTVEFVQSAGHLLAFLTMTCCMYSKELDSLRAKRRRNQTAAEKLKLAHLPQTIRLIEMDIDTLVEELGGDHYRDMPGASST